MWTQGSSNADRVHAGTLDVAAPAPSPGEAPAAAAVSSVATPAAGVAGQDGRFLRRLAAEELTLRRPADGPGRIARALRRAEIDLNPHQVDAAVTALRALKDRGVVLADEVGLGKTIEAGLVIAQLFAEGKDRIIVLAPASLRKQWARELEEKLGIPSIIVDGSTVAEDLRQGRKPKELFERAGRVVISSHPFGARRAEELEAVRWDCVVIDEAHRLRGAHKGSKTALALRNALYRRPKLLLTATPMQNGLSELYGLLTFLDPDVLGSPEQFRRAFPDAMPGSTVQDLRARVKPYVHRTLRRQVREYVRYTERRSMVCEFTPTRDEARLYEHVSEYLADPETLAIDPARRHLMVLVYRKLLASSPAAIAGTLAQLARGLESRLGRGEHLPAGADEDAEEIYRELVEEHEAAAGPPEDRPRPPVTSGRIADEIDRLMRMSRLASSITRPAKLEALLSALDRAFTEAASRGWPQKAVVFTESRRTLDMLYAALEAAGNRGMVTALHGASGDADARARIVEDFRGHCRILLLTEAGAEGLNLQFANLIVNYDLPWNPQRVEQRIGRCHRYGQQRDVVVLNFLASDNEAEKRLYELLSSKLELFDGIFGATDDVLGALGDGAAFERDVADIFGRCRDESAIKSAFDALQRSLEGEIAERMGAAKAAICDFFDDDIRARLRMTGQQAAAQLDRDEAQLVRLVRGAFPGQQPDALGRLELGDGLGTIETSRKHRTPGGSLLTVDHPVAARLIHELKADAPAEVRYTLFPYTRNKHKVSRLEPLLGGEGWWLAYRVSFDGPLSEDHVVHVVLMKTASGETVVLEDAQIDALLGIDALDIEPRPRLRAATLASRYADEVLEGHVQALTAHAESRKSVELARQRELVELAVEDRLRLAAELVFEAQAGWKSARAGGGPADVERAFRELGKRQEREAEERKSAAAWRKERLHAIESRSELEIKRSLIATAYFWLE